MVADPSLRKRDTPKLFIATIHVIVLCAEHGIFTAPLVRDDDMFGPACHGHHGIQKCMVALHVKQAMLSLKDDGNQEHVPVSAPVKKGECPAATIVTSAKEFNWAFN